MTILCLTALAAAQAPGVSGGEIKIGSCSALDGPARQLGLETVLGATAYFDYLNDHGGVNGRKVHLLSFDDGYDPEKSGACFASLKRENVFAGGFFVGTPTAAKYLPLAEAEHLPSSDYSRERSFSMNRSSMRFSICGPRTTMRRGNRWMACGDRVCAESVWFIRTTVSAKQSSRG